ncbi:uncharacterized protein PHACADRAFT_207004 [Phanerochaete carnosa HHB-10118-sp]|uniref:NADP-dependent oxidoreductase domain-containing protein n=1 Tax=Phanerochaete carnosa (strain HHB-10118-sp) TaxID=650164 RepID=K5V640_PHACS|nr:uncharacterized protein PHACADRAFT_207004 [Phanerochaete carnosa HHB-10118-sp]EKM58171.1 hypothetical protein PHACADRAFT_207004 [Phanerochaete carnosa HHB-10118-sp]
MSLPTRKIGDANVSCLGFGRMGLSAYYGPTKPDEERLKVLDAAYEHGCTLWDTSDIYGDSEDLFGQWFKRTGKRSEIFLATKFCIRVVDVADASKGIVIDGTPEHARPDKNVPIELTISAMAEAVKAGQVKYIGISGCTEDTLRRAHAVHHLSAAQFEYAPFTLNIEDPQIGIRNACKELGIPLVASCPLGRGILSGKFARPRPSTHNREAPNDGDTRKMLDYPRLRAENFRLILKLIDTLTEIGKRHGATTAQVTLAWVLAQGPDVIPIPGTTNPGRVEENANAVNVQLTAEEVKAIRDAVELAGLHKISRAAEGFLNMHFVSTPPLPK